MIRPFVLMDSALEFVVVVGAAADVDDEEIVVMILVEVSCNIIDGVSVNLFEEVGGGIGHGDDAISDIS